MEFGTSALVAAPVVIFVAYFVFGMTGFGSSIIAVPLLAHFLPLKLVVPFMVLLDFIASALVGGRSHQHVNRDEMKWLVPFFVLGIVAGVVLLVGLPAQPLLFGLGLFVLGFGAYNVVEFGHQGSVSRRWAVPVGLAGGVFSALFGTGGPVYAVYLSRRLTDKFELRATTSAMVTVSTVLRIALYLMSGLLLQWKLLGAVFALVPVMMLGIKLGSRMHLGLSPQRVRQAIGALLVVSGVSLLAKALF